LRAVALALALVAAAACGFTSGLESAGILGDLAIKGRTAMEEADGMMRQNRPEAALVILRRHMHDVDDAIKKVEQDQLINDRQKARLLQELKRYERGFDEGSKMIRATINMQNEMRR